MGDYSEQVGKRRPALVVKRSNIPTASLIARKAADLFRQKGYHATSMSDIAKAVGVQKSALYHHYPSKQAILEFIAKRGTIEVLPELEVIAASPAPVEERLSQVIRLLILTICSRPAEAGIQVVLFVFERHSVPANLLAQHRDNQNGLRRLITKLVSEGIETGVFQSDNPRLTTFAILSMIGYLTVWYQQSGPSSPEEIADHFVDLIVCRLLKKPSNDNDRLQVSGGRAALP